MRLLAQDSPFMAMGLVMVPALLLMSNPVRARVSEKMQGQAFFFFMWSILSLPLNIGVHVSARLMGLRIPFLLGAGIVLASGFGFQAAFMNQGRKSVSRYSDLVAYLLLCAPLVFIFLTYARQRRDPYLYYQALVLVIMGVLVVLQHALSRNGQAKLDRWLDFLAFRLRFLFMFAMVLFFVYRIIEIFWRPPQPDFFWAFIGIVAFAAAALFFGKFSV